MQTLLALLSDQQNQQTLSWIGGGLVVVAGGLWAVIKYFFPRSAGGSTPPNQTITADRGGIAAGGSVSIGSKHGLSGIEVALLVAVVVGGLLLALAFAGTRITVENGVGVGGNVKNSTISIQRGGTEP